MDVETKWQKKWKDCKVFEPKISTQEKFFATVPYPYANSALHIGHGRGYTTPDIFIRYQRLKGKNVLFPLGYHISGTPVLAVADSIARKDEKQIELTRQAISDYVYDTKEQDAIIATFTDPNNIAKFFSETIEKSLDAVGISIDWSRQFSTGDLQYSKFIEWQFQKLHDAGILVRGKYPILYSHIDENAVGEDDIKDGDTEKVTVQEMSYILFKLVDANQYIAVSTLRPDALFGTTNLWVDPKIPLISVLVNGQTWIVSEDTLVKLKYQFDSVKDINAIDGKLLIGKKVLTPITHREVLIAQASFIDSKHGTGIVYSSPAGAPHDFIGLIEAKKEGRLPEDVEVIRTVDTFDKNGKRVEYKGSCPAEDKILKYGVKSSEDLDGLEKAKQELYKEEHYGGKLNALCGEFEGVPIKYAKDKVHQKLVDLKLGGVLYETSRRAITRAGNDVIVANLEGQWFLDYSKPEIKEKAYALLDRMVYNPHKIKATQKGYLEWVHMRPCARKRGLGTKLPFDKDWVIESLSDSTIYQMYYLVAHIINREKISAKQLTVDFFDYIYLDVGNAKEVSTKTGISENILAEIVQQVAYWKSFDFRYTAGAHLSNHLSFLIYHYALIFPEKLQPKSVTVGGMLIKDGAKISKSKGNGVPLIHVKEKYGVDLYRLYIAVGANYDIEMDFRDEEIFQLEKKFKRWQDIIGASLNLLKPKYSEFSLIDKWLVSRFYSQVATYFEMFDGIRIREAYVGLLYEFMNDVNYHERRTSLKQTQNVLRFIAEDYIILMSPAIPHICEEFYSRLHENAFVSLAKFTTEYAQYIDKSVEDIELIAQELTASITRTKTSRNIQSISKVSIVQALDEKFALFDSLKRLLDSKKEIKTIFSELQKEFPNDSKFIQRFVPKTLGSGLNAYLPRSEERVFFESLVPFLKKEFNCDIEIIDDSERAKSAIPGRPTIIVE